MMLIELLREVVNIDQKLDRNISGLTDDSRILKKGDLFVAYPGERQDGRKFIAEAIAKEVSAIICEAEKLDLDINQSPVPIIPVAKLRSKVGAIAAKFYAYPSKKMDIVGITGTSGKTSVSNFIAHALQKNGIKCGLIGTLGSGFPNNLVSSVNTTPGAIFLQQKLTEFLRQQARAVAMEVSSHSLEQGRVNGMDFSVGVFTNLSHEHLDYHGDMVSYGEVKKRLFTDYNLSNAVINADDAFGQQLLVAVTKKVPTIAYSITEAKTDGYVTVRASELKMRDNGFAAKVVTPWGSGILTSKLLGRFNVSNLLAALSVLITMGIPLEQALESLSAVSVVAGRMEAFGGGDQPLVVVDFAHKPDALEKVLLELRAHCHGKLWCVFGCGGDRDRSKRPLMGQLAERYSDFVIITDDNPRTENPQQIVNDIVNGLLCPWGAEIEHDRATAIAYAINNAKSGDIVLIAGKGHETYQLCGNEKIPFSDVEQARTLLGC